MQFVYTPERVCSKVFMIEVDEATRTITNFEFKGGCPGNLQAIGRLVRGMHIDEVISRFDNMPIILETPDESRWAEEIALLRSFE